MAEKMIKVEITAEHVVTHTNTVEISEYMYEKLIELNGKHIGYLDDGFYDIERLIDQGEGDAGDWTDFSIKKIE